jgi:hypothetical protein
MELALSTTLSPHISNFNHSRLAYLQDSCDFWNLPNSSISLHSGDSHSTAPIVACQPELVCNKATMKRACDCCIRRKVKCDGNQPCRKCDISRPQLTCTYLTPARKRGPKSSKAALLRRRSKKLIPSPTLPRQEASKEATFVSRDHNAVAELPLEATVLPQQTPLNLQGTLQISIDVLRSVIEVYRSRMYPVWPVIEATKLLSQLEHGYRDTTDYILATSLCAATMAQLHLPPMISQGREVSSADLERECSRVRATCDYREHPNLNHVLTSFFLHVYHAKMDNQNSALLYIQEAILLARLLRLDEDDGPYHGDDAESVADGCIVYLLLWISERWAL